MGECCDEIIERLEAIEALLAAGPVRSPDDIRDDVNDVQEGYEQRIEEITIIYDNDITNVHPDMAYGDSNDPIRDQALCFITRRFVDMFCDWIVQNIQLKVANQQTALNVASFVGNASDVAARLFAETAYGAMFSNIAQMLDLEVSALTVWVTSVTEAHLAIYQDENARDEVACGWYNALKGETPYASVFMNSLDTVILSGNADIIATKLAAALTPVAVPQQPDGERLYFIWADLWKEAYDGALVGIVPACECEEPVDPDCNDLTASAHGWYASDGGGTAQATFGQYISGQGLAPNSDPIPDPDNRSFFFTRPASPTSPASVNSVTLNFNQAVTNFNFRRLGKTAISYTGTATTSITFSESTHPSFFPLNMQLDAVAVTFTTNKAPNTGFRVVEFCWEPL